MNELSLARIVDSARYGSCLVYTINDPKVAFRISPTGLVEIDGMEIIGVDLCEF